MTHLSIGTYMHVSPDSHVDCTLHSFEDSEPFSHLFQIWLFKSLSLSNRLGSHVDNADGAVASVAPPITHRRQKKILPTTRTLQSFSSHLTYFTPHTSTGTYSPKSASSTGILFPLTPWQCIIDILEYDQYGEEQ